MTARPISQVAAIAASAAGNGPVTLEPIGKGRLRLLVAFRALDGATHWQRQHATEFAARTTYDEMQAAVAAARRNAAA